MGKFTGSVEILVIVGWSICIRLNSWAVHQTWRSTNVGIKRNQEQVDRQTYASFDDRVRNNNCVSFYGVYDIIRCL